ncbi:MAG: type V CRISPR-associated endonuclease Cas1 [Phocaeicola sp.]|nr:type V CRISPR-associated endonuclease Cas1 [Phocaeicola sp.]
MYTFKDIDFKTVFVINCIDHERSLRVINGELLLEERIGDKNKTLTKIPFQKLLALFVIGHLTITTPLMEKCRKYNVALVTMKPNLRPVFYWAEYAEANFLLRKKQYEYPDDDITIAKQIVSNKIRNQLIALNKTRKKDDLTKKAIDTCKLAIESIYDISDYSKLLGLEGLVSKSFFCAYYNGLGWNKRLPRTKMDILNVTLDIGYSILFNYIECFVRMFGFDLYKGIYHRSWFKRKSLVCDLMEPFRCIIDHTILLAYNRNQFKKTDFVLLKSEYHLKNECCSEYYRLFYSTLIEYKMDVFRYIQSYYRFFMQRKSETEFPIFKF